MERQNRIGLHFSAVVSQETPVLTVTHRLRFPPGRRECPVDAANNCSQRSVYHGAAKLAADNPHCLRNGPLFPTCDGQSNCCVLVPERSTHGDLPFVPIKSDSLHQSMNAVWVPLRIDTTDIGIQNAICAFPSWPRGLALASSQHGGARGNSFLSDEELLGSPCKSPPSFGDVNQSRVLRQHGGRAGSVL